MPLIVRWSAWFAAIAASLAAAALGLAWPPALWALALFAPLALVGLWDLIQTRHSLRRNYPLLARFRWFFEDLRPYLRSYIVEGDLEGRPFDRDQRAIVYARAKGQEDAHPFGTELDVYSGEYEWMAHSIAPVMDDTGHDFRVEIGGPQCPKPYCASLLNISAMSFGALGGNAIEALNLGAKRGNFFHDTGEGAVSPYHLKHGGDIVWELGSGYFGCRAKDGRFDSGRFQERALDPRIKMIEIKLSQGAKPGHGGLLPGAKVTREIAETRGVPPGEDCLSPAGHTAFSTPREMLAFAARLRDMSGGKPVGIKLCVGHPHEVFAVMKAMLESEILLDFIVVDGAEGGTGAAPVELSNSVGAPLQEGLVLVRNALVGAGLRDRVRLGASGKVHSGAGLAVNSALGADWSNAARAFMFSLGCVQSMKCHTGNCPTGVATQDKARQRGLVVEEKAERVTRFHDKTMKALGEITRASGFTHPREFEPHHLHQNLTGSVSRPGDQAFPFVGPNALVDDPASTPYADYWRAADADSFRPKVSLHDARRRSGMATEQPGV